MFSTRHRRCHTADSTTAMQRALKLKASGVAAFCNCLHPCSPCDVVAGSGEDTSEARPMADTRFGDIFDVLNDDAGGDVVSRYRVVIVAGHVDIEANKGGKSLVDVLMQHVLGGGVAVVAVGNIGNSTAGVSLTGFVPNGFYSTSRAWSVAPQASSSSSSSSSPPPSSPSSSFTREALLFAAGSLAPEDPSLNTSTSALVRPTTFLFHKTKRNTSPRSSPSAPDLSLLL